MNNAGTNLIEKKKKKGKKELNCPKSCLNNSKKLPVKTWLWPFFSSETPAVPLPQVGMQAEPSFRLLQVICAWLGKSCISQPLGMAPECVSWANFLKKQFLTVLTFFSPLLSPHSKVCSQICPNPGQCGAAQFMQQGWGAAPHPEELIGNK